MRKGINAPEYQQQECKYAVYDAQWENIKGIENADIESLPEWQ